MKTVPFLKNPLQQVDCPSKINKLVSNLPLEQLKLKHFSKAFLSKDFIQQ